MDKEKFAATACARFKACDDFWHNWRAAAVDDFGFIAGSQWLQEDEAHLSLEKRPAITFNYSEKMIDAVVGAEVSNRQEATYRPRGVEDAGAAELWNNAAKWVRDECGAEDEESDAFRDMLICGMGWTYTRLSYDEDQDGKLLVERVDPLEMRSDPAASKPGLTDRRYAYRRWWIDEADAKKEWPKATFPNDSEDNTNRGVITHGHRYNDESDDNSDDRHKDQVRITMYECVEREPVMLMIVGGKIEEISMSEFGSMKQILDSAGAKYVKHLKRVYYRGFFAGETLLDAELSPCQDGFTFQAITGKRDRNHNTWYGLTKVMKDPQRWANKWLSQILHIVNSNAKGGLMAEINTFVDPKKAQEEWSRPDTVTLFKEGALSGNKVKEKQAGNFPAGLDKLMQFALGSLPMVTGINLEALGLANREQAGVLEQQRKQAAYGLLSPLFDALRRYRKSQGRVLLHMINAFISDGRMVRIGGAESQQFLPLTKQEGAIRYDVIVDQSPNAPDVKERTWEALMQLVPNMLKAGLPLPPDLLDYSPLPVALATKWKQFASQNPPPDPKMQQMQQEMQKLAEENQQLKQDQASKQGELVLKAQAQQADIALKQHVADAELRMKEDLMQKEFALSQAKAGHEAHLSETKVKNEHTVKKMAIENTPEAAVAGENKANSKATLDALKALTDTLASPRELITDKTGKPIGSRIATKSKSTGAKNA